MPAPLPDAMPVPTLSLSERLCVPGASAFCEGAGGNLRGGVGRQPRGLGDQARCHSSILQRFVQYWDTQGLDKRKMDHLLRWAQAELVRQVGDADNSPTFRKGFVRGLPYIQTIWKRLCEGFARAATTAMEDIQVNLDDIGLEHVLAANAGLLANSVRGLSPWAATALRAEQRLEFQVRCRPPPARARAATRTLWAAQLLARSFCKCAVTLTAAPPAASPSSAADAAPCPFPVPLACAGVGQGQGGRRIRQVGQGARAAAR